MTATNQFDMLEALFAVDWQDCPHESGYMGGADDNGSYGYFCDNCENLIWSCIPEPPEVLGYLSAVWQHWQTTGRYPTTVIEQFSKMVNAANAASKARGEEYEF